MPSRARSLLVLAALLALLATATLRFGAGTSDAAVSSTLHAMVNDNYEIALSFDDGSPVTSIPAGSYRVVVSDTTTEHNFHLFGPGVEQATGVSAEGTSTWNVTFQAGGRYQYVCDLHSDTMYGRFDAGGSSDAAPATGGGSSTGSGGGGSSSSSTNASGGSVSHTTSSSTGASVLGTLSARVAASGKPTLTSKGKSVKTLAAGKYTLTLTDASSKSAVELMRIGSSAKTLTSVVFSGQKSVALVLTAGQWKLFPSSHPASTIAFRVTSS